MAAVGPVLDGPFAPGWYSAHISWERPWLFSWERPRLFWLNASVGELTASSALETLNPGDSEFLIGRCPGPRRPDEAGRHDLVFTGPAA